MLFPNNGYRYLKKRVIDALKMWQIGGGIWLVSWVTKLYPGMVYHAASWSVMNEWGKIFHALPVRIWLFRHSWIVVNRIYSSHIFQPFMPNQSCMVAWALALYSLSSIVVAALLLQGSIGIWSVYRNSVFLWYIFIGAIIHCFYF